MSASVRQMPLVCPGHNRGIVELQYSPETPEGIFLISACLDGKPMIRDGVTGDWIGTFEGHKGAVWGAAISSDATRAATGAADFTARVWDAITGECLTTLQQKHICKSVAFSNDGQRLLTAGNTPAICIYDVASGEESPVSLLGGADGGVKKWRLAKYVGTAKDTVVAASGEGKDKFLSVWDVRSGEEVRKLPLGAGVKSGEISHDGSTLNVTCEDATAIVYDLMKFEKTRTLTLSEKTESSSINSSMDMMVSGGLDLTVRRWSCESGQELEANRGHHGPVWVVRFAPDGESYASGSDDATIRIWSSDVSKLLTDSQ
eukprot:Plantae.Rhodophyta-Hildenbrandia_rubra.ctg15196.p1 GENE.Plantae.Rhodophyta-Hildenbrandia_rubra.ctg15196~~Plantae.Rhodophyta-Hildenbrandia_rubra.ctg15196.p1  ORF type:complete len:317 (+),score=50.48 Plantae.Rhodophyta-Hildenbrandia_rubra.ctg15196:1633-2583(+)